MGKKNVVTYISMISEILRYKLIKQTKQKPDMKNIKKLVNSVKSLLTSLIYTNLSKKKFQMITKKEKTPKQNIKILFTIKWILKKN